MLTFSLSVFGISLPIEMNGSWKMSVLVGRVRELFRRLSSEHLPCTDHHL